MTQKIDADVLREKLIPITHWYVNEYLNKAVKAVEIDDIINIINELVTSAEPQESSIKPNNINDLNHLDDINVGKIDADGWLDIKTAPPCTMLIVYDHENKLSAVATYRPSYSSNHDKNWRDAWNYSKGIGFVPTKWRPLLKTPKEAL